MPNKFEGVPSATRPRNNEAQAAPKFLKKTFGRKKPSIEQSTPEKDFDFLPSYTKLDEIQDKARQQYADLTRKMNADAELYHNIHGGTLEEAFLGFDENEKQSWWDKAKGSVMNFWRKTNHTLAGNKQEYLTPQQFIQQYKKDLALLEQYGRDAGLAAYQPFAPTVPPEAPPAQPLFRAAEQPQARASRPRLSNADREAGERFRQAALDREAARELREQEKRPALEKLNAKSQADIEREFFGDEALVEKKIEKKTPPPVPKAEVSAQQQALSEDYLHVYNLRHANDTADMLTLELGYAFPNVKTGQELATAYAKAVTEYQKLIKPLKLSYNRNVKLEGKLSPLILSLQRQIMAANRYAGFNPLQNVNGLVYLESQKNPLKKAEGF